MKRDSKLLKGFTLVELLIVIALISILSVAVLATINPIEQSNKAKDSTVQNDAAEVLNAVERFYASQSRYPWMGYTDAVGVDDARVYRSDMGGFGMCYSDLATNTSQAPSTECAADATNKGELVALDELKPAFVGKDEFTTLATNDENALWLVKQAGSGGAIYVCYIPKSKSSRQQTDKLYCINNADPLNPVMSPIDGNPTDGAGCDILPPSDANWSTPDMTGSSAMFRCVPE